MNTKKQDRQEELVNLCIPLMKFLKKNYDPHTKIILDQGYWELFRGESWFTRIDKSEL